MMDELHTAPSAPTSEPHRPARAPGRAVGFTVLAAAACAAVGVFGSMLGAVLGGWLGEQYSAVLAHWASYLSQVTWAGVGLLLGLLVGALVGATCRAAASLSLVGAAFGAVTMVWCGPATGSAGAVDSILRWAALAAVTGAVALVVREAIKRSREREIDALLQTLLEVSARNDRTHQSRFFTTLLALARKHGDRLLDAAGTWFMDEGYAVRVGSVHVVAILRGSDPFIPGSDTQCLLLLSAEGRLLDTLACSISNRLTRMVVDHAGTFRTDVPQAPEEDGGQLIIRYMPAAGGSVSGNWSHEITHAGRVYTFRWDQDRPGTIRSAEWDAKGLCRVAVQGDRFSVVFPRLEKEAAGRR